MKRAAFLLVFLLGFMASERVLAMRTLTYVSAEQLREWGVAITTDQGTDGLVAVRIRFQPRGELRKFHHAELELKSAKQSFLRTTMRPLTTERGELRLYFSALPSWITLSQITLIVERDGNADLRPDGYVVKLSDVLSKETK